MVSGALTVSTYESSIDRVIFVGSMNKYTFVALVQQIVAKLVPTRQPSLLTGQ
jgi:hypothetical protein